MWCGYFMGLYKTIGDIIVRGDSYEFFLDYFFYSKLDSKVFSSFRKRIIPNAFSDTLFNNDNIRYDSGALQIDRSNVFFFFTLDHSLC